MSLSRSVAIIIWLFCILIIISQFKSIIKQFNVLTWGVREMWKSWKCYWCQCWKNIKDRLIRPLIIRTVHRIGTISLGTDTLYWQKSSIGNSDSCLILTKITVYFNVRSHQANAKGTSQTSGLHCFPCNCSHQARSKKTHSYSLSLGVNEALVRIKWCLLCKLKFDKIVAYCISLYFQERLRCEHGES